MARLLYRLQGLFPVVQSECSRGQSVYRSTEIPESYIDIDGLYVDLGGLFYFFFFFLETIIIKHIIIFMHNVCAYVCTNIAPRQRFLFLRAGLSLFSSK